MVRQPGKQQRGLRGCGRGWVKPLTELVHNDRCHACGFAQAWLDCTVPKSVP
jgi:hypothetical protein